MPAELATIGSIKALLEIPDDEEAYDGALKIAVDAANARILGMTGYSVIDETGRTEMFRKVYPGQIIILRKRPVAAITSVEGRNYSEGWTLLTHDLIDADQGMVVPIVPARRGGGQWLAPWEREGDDNWYNWDMVRVIYDVTQWSDVDPLVAGVANSLAVYLWHRYGAGAAMSRQIGDLQERLLTIPIPDWVQDGLAEHMRGRATIA